MQKLSLALAVTMNCELKLGLDWSRSSMVHAPLVIHPLHSEGSCRACNTRHMVCVVQQLRGAGTTSATQVHSQVKSELHGFSLRLFGASGF